MLIFQVRQVSDIGLGTAYEILFDDNVAQATEEGEIIVKIETGADPDLFHGCIDVITYSIRDL